MKVRFPILLTSLLALALATPGLATEKDKDKSKDKKKDKTEQTDHDREGDDHGDDDRDGKGKVTICHIPPGNAGARHTITVSDSAWDAHRKHGDRRGACDHDGDGDGHGDGHGDAFDRLDRNHDGRISRSEWTSGDDSFRRLDRNGDGVLSRDEFARHESEPDRRRFEDLDRNRDGRISRSEWPWGRESFDRADRNHDDLVSREEYGRP